MPIAPRPSHIRRIAPAPKRHRLNRHRRHTALHHLYREVMLISGFRGPLRAMLVDAHNVVHPAPMPGHTDHWRKRCLLIGRRQ
jgi:hypothetical protein